MKTLITLFIAILFFILLEPINTNAQCHIDDWTALKALYESTNGTNWINNSGWEEVAGNTSTSNCNLNLLYGVTLDINGRVTCLDLDGVNNCGWNDVDGNNLTGILPPEIGQLSGLVVLRLNNNNIGGIIPPEIGALNNLSNLSLQHNNLIGSIPPQIGNLQNLNRLLLYDNNLIGSIPSQLGNLSNVDWLSLSQNNLSNNIPPEFGNLTNLNLLGLENNLLTGNIPPQLGNLENVAQIWLFNNQLTGSIPVEFQNLSNLTTLHIFQNNLSGCYSANLISFCNQLTSGNSSISEDNNFDASWEDFCADNSGICLPSQCQIDDWTALKVLYENTDGNNWIDNTGWEEVTGNTPTANCNLANLYGVGLDENGRVDSLYMYDNQLNGSIPAELSLLHNVTRLWLSHNQLDGSIPPELGNLSNLTNLWLGYNQLNGKIPAELGNLSNLVGLYLNNNPINGSIPLELGNLYNLKWLLLDNNQLSGSIPAEISNLSVLEMLSVNDNNLTGCFNDNLTILCEQLISTHFDGNLDISDGNNFDATWEDFCLASAGVCTTTEVYPGDLNNDGIVNNQDVGLSGLFLYETGPARATEHQNIDWYPYPAEDWNRQQINNEDIKHFDCNGDGVITEDDQEAVEANIGLMWSAPVQVDPVEESDYQIVLYPVEEMNPNFLRIHIALENATGSDLVLQGGHFTIDYGMDNQNITNATINFSPYSWLGVIDLNLIIFKENFPSTQTMEIGFTRIDGMDAIGSGIIGELILQLDNSSNRIAKQGDCILQIQVKTIGIHDSQANNQPVENRLLQINMCESICENTWYINDDTQFQNKYRSSNLVETEGFLIIGNEQQVEYRSDRVCLQAGFKVQAGATFKAGNRNCE